MKAVGVVRFSALEGARGVLAWWVVASHILSRSAIHGHDLAPQLHFLRSGYYAVDVFIILSGFVITHLLLSSEQSYTRFIVARFARIYPVFIVTFLAAVVLHGLQINVLEAVRTYTDAVRADTLVEQYRSTEQNALAHIVTHIFLVHGMIPDSVLLNASNAYLGTAWSISLEWQFYVVAPLLMLGLRRYPHVAVFGLVALGGLGRELQWGERAALSYSLLYFAIGIITALLVHRIGRRGFLVGMLCVAVVVAAHADWTRNALNGPMVPLGFWIVLTASLLFPDTTVGRAISKLFSSAPLQFLGRISYSTYLWHILTLAVAQWVMFQVYPPSDRTELFLLTIALAVPLTLIVSVLSYRWIEQPGINAGQRFLRKHHKRRADPIAAAE